MQPKHVMSSHGTRSHEQRGFVRPPGILLSSGGRLERVDIPGQWRTRTERLLRRTFLFAAMIRLQEEANFSLGLELLLGRALALDPSAGPDRVIVSVRVAAGADEEP